MSNKRKRSRCKFHIIGQYFHSSSELVNFCIASDIDGMGRRDAILYYQFCPSCGEKITEKIKMYQMQNTSKDQNIKEERLENKRKAGGERKQTCRIPKRKCIIKKVR